MISVFAYHAVHLIRCRLKEQGIHLNWTSIRDRMESWQRVTTTFRDVDGLLHVCRQDGRPGAEALAIAGAAGLEVRRWPRWSG